MTPAANAGDFDETLGCLTETAVEGLAAQLASIAGLTENERSLATRGAQESLTRILHGKLSRLLLLELNAARVDGGLKEPSSDARWAEFIARASTPAFWQSLSRHYPNLLTRVEAIVHNRCASIAAFARRFSDDRERLADFNLGPLGTLSGLTLSAGDSHRGGQAVIIVRCEHGSLVYKPRSVAVDVQLDHFIRSVQKRTSLGARIRTPRTLDCGEYGWSEYIRHQYVTDPSQLPDFYQGIGQWLALMRLLGGCDLHAENLIAHGAVPIIIDCETLFAPRLKPMASGMGAAFDLASERISGSVMSIGLLPSRGAGLGWRGVDVSGIGSLPGQQPLIPQPRIVGSGRDDARIGTVLVPAQSAQNHPSEQLSLNVHWPQVLQGFEDMNRALGALDSGGALSPLLSRFMNCPIRVVTRSTEAYAEIGRMLWHPVSLHKPSEARQQAHQLLARMAEQKPLAPDDDAVIAGEIADLMEGDVPFFSTTPGHGQLQGPRGTLWLEPRNLVSASLEHWRNADWTLEQEIVKSTLISAYEHDVWPEPSKTLRISRPVLGDLENRRRQQAEQAMRLLKASAIRGHDGSVAWIASVLGPAGRMVQPLGQDLYGGIAGIALTVAAYRHEVGAERASPIPGLDSLMTDLIRTMEWAEAQSFLRRGRVKRPRPPATGGYIGLGSQIWTWLTLERLEKLHGAGIEHASRLASLMPESIAGDEVDDLLSGKAGAIVPLLMLAKIDGRADYLGMAVDIGNRLCASAKHDEDAAYWSHERWPRGMGGFAHGVTGIAWALSKLSRSTGTERFEETAAAARAFEERLYDPSAGNWSDLRMLHGADTPAAWCHGAVGIGLAAIDLDPMLDDSQVRDRVATAAATAWTQGIGQNHGICHGDMGAWELLDRSIRAGAGPTGLEREKLLASLVGSLERHGPVCGLAGKSYTPGLMGGLAGVTYQLLRAHPDSPLPSVMTMDTA